MAPASVTDFIHAMAPAIVTDSIPMIAPSIAIKLISLMTLAIGIGFPRCQLLRGLKCLKKNYTDACSLLGEASESSMKSIALADFVQNIKHFAGVFWAEQSERYGLTAHDSLIGRPE
jgi:hypothetical protein